MQRNNTSSLNNIKSNSLWIYLVFFLFSIIFLLFYSGYTSPIFNTYGGDSSIFIILGKMLLAGKTPYVDFFDHKGPMLIFIEAIGLSLHPDERTGIFILQIINLTFVQIISYKCACVFLTKKISISAALVTLLLFSFTIQGGNTNGEYCLPFSFLTLLFTLKYLYLKDYSLKPLHYFIIGICGAVTFWIRLNNTNIILACLICMVILMLCSRDWRSFRLLIIYFSLGFFVITTPIIIFFIARGAMTEMIDAVFLFNFKYSGFSFGKDLTTLHFILRYIIKSWLSLIILIIGTSLFYRRSKNRKLLLLSLLMLIIGYFSTHIGFSFFNYMTLNIPCGVLGAIFILLSFKNDILRLRIAGISSCLIIIFLIVVAYVKRHNNYFMEMQDDTEFIAQSSEILSHIPVDERNSVFIYNSGESAAARFLTNTGILPIYKHFTNHEWHALFDKDIFDNINCFIETDKPLWIVIEYNMEIKNTGFLDIISEEYKLETKSGNLYLYKLVE